MYRDTKGLSMYDDVCAMQTHIPAMEPLDR